MARGTGAKKITVVTVCVCVCEWEAREKRGWRKTEGRKSNRDRFTVRLRQTLLWFILAVSYYRSPVLCACLCMSLSLSSPLVYYRVSWPVCGQPPCLPILSPLSRFPPSFFHTVLPSSCGCAPPPLLRHSVTLHWSFVLRHTVTDGGESFIDTTTPGLAYMNKSGWECSVHV